MGQTNDFSQHKPKNDCRFKGLSVRKNLKGTKEKEPVDHMENQERAILGVIAVVYGEDDLTKAVYKLGKMAYTNPSSFRELYLSFVSEIDTKCPHSL